MVCTCSIHSSLKRFYSLNNKEQDYVFLKVRENLKNERHESWVSKESLLELIESNIQSSTLSSGGHFVCLELGNPEYYRNNK